MPISFNHNDHKEKHKEHNEYSLCEHCAFFVLLVVNLLRSECFSKKINLISSMSHRDKIFLEK
jgi:hypothetical protein